MASSVSLEYLRSLYNQPDGIPQLDENGVLFPAQLPPGFDNNFKGTFATEAALTTAYPSGTTGDYAYVTATLSYWYWNAAISVPAWVNQEVTDTVYTALTAAEKAAVPYIIVP